MALSKPFAGRQYGCIDTSAPESHSAYTLSRLTDAMYAAQEAGLDYKAVFKLAPRQHENGLELRKLEVRRSIKLHSHKAKGTFSVPFLRLATIKCLINLTM